MTFAINRLPDNYYNEIDPFAAAWLRALIAAGHISPGEVDTRSIEDVRPDDLKRYVQCHFFAGIGVWSYALRRTGWPDERPIWTGSCPCPPFSSAGKKQQCPACGSKRNLCHPRKSGHFICLACGCDRHADERHLWPEFSRLIRECGPAIVVGEQVASVDGRLWLDVVSADLRLASYGVAGADICAAGVGAPHIRQRLWWVGKRLADAKDGRQPRGYRTDGGDRTEAIHNRGSSGLADAGLSEPSERRRATADDDRRRGAGRVQGGELAPRGGHDGRLGDDDARLEGQRSGYQTPGGRIGAVRPAAATGEFGGLADTHDNEQREGRDAGSADSQGVRDGPGQRSIGGRVADTPHDGRAERTRDVGSGGTGSAPERLEQLAGRGVLCDDHRRPGPVNGRWADADWLFCRDGKWRPVEPGTFPLVDGASARVGRLRGYGNAIVAEVAQTFIEALLESEGGRHLRLTLDEVAADIPAEGIFA